MEIHFEKDGVRFKSDLQSATSIAIDMDFDGGQPNHFGVAKASRQPLTAGDFVGSTRRGGPCNVEVLTMIPHCNGTHTESVGHIVDEAVPVGQFAKSSLFAAELISVQPGPATGADSYTPDLRREDIVISAAVLSAALGQMDHSMVDALIVRTQPNDTSKCTRVYGQDQIPAFFSTNAMQLIVATGIDHLLVDLPSVDRMYDDGMLSNHHLFWNVQQGQHQLNDQSEVVKTITEMIYVPNTLVDGTYLLNLQIAPMMCDAAPSRPILFPIQTGDQ